MSNVDKTLCPSAPYDSPDAKIFGVVTGSVEQPEVTFLDKPEPVTDELLELAKPASPKEVFRISSPCAQGNCSHFNGESNTCRLVEKTVRIAPKVVEMLPVCAIRAECKWWEQEGKEACMRCPQVATLDLSRPDEIDDVANPAVL